MNATLAFRAVTMAETPLGPGGPRGPPGPGGPAPPAGPTGPRGPRVGDGITPEARSVALSERSTTCREDTELAGRRLTA